jgi:hypothetical protein
MAGQTDQEMPAGATWVEIVSTMPVPVYTAPPTFRYLDVNGDGVISEREASAYPLLANDFLYASHHRTVITRPQYERWSAHVGASG